MINNYSRDIIMNKNYYEVIGYKQSENGKYTVIIERDDKRKTIYTIHNNELGTKKIMYK
jgi:hypothetical protein